MKTITYKLPHTIVQIRVADKRPVGGYEYFHEYKVSRGWFRSPKIYNHVFVSEVGGYFGGSSTTCINTLGQILEYKTTDGLKSKYLVQNNILYYRPCVTVTFANKKVDSTTKEFDTFEEASEWAKKVIEDNELSNTLIEFN